MTGPPGRRHGIGTQPDGVGGVPGEPGHRAGVAQGERAFEVDEVTEGHQQLVELGRRQREVMVGGSAQRHVPGVAGLGSVEDGRSVRDERPDHRGVEMLAAAALHHLHRGRHAAGAVMNLGHVGQVRDPHLDGDLVAAGTRGQATAVVALEAEADRVLHAGTQSHPFGKQRGGGAMRVDEPGHVAAGVHEQGGDGLQSLQQRLTAADVARQEAVVGQSGPVDLVGVPAHRDVVTEPLRELVGVGVASDPHDQRRVVHAVTLFTVQPEPVRDAGTDQRRTQHVFGGLPQTEIDRHGQRGQHFGPARCAGPGTVPGGRRGHALDCPP